MSCWFHVDMDAFYAAVEQRDNPEYRGKPLIIGGNPDSRGVVSTASYEARKFGVHSAMPTSQAYRLCPQGIFIFPRMETYSSVSKEIMQLFHDFTPTVLQVSIDEAFLDMTGTENLFGSPREAGTTIKQRVYKETGLTLSVGIGSSKFIAKMASGLQKPDGLTYVPQGKEEEFVESLEMGDLWGVGKKTQQRLRDMNITTVPMLKAVPLTALQGMFGTASGHYLFQVCRGIDPGIYTGSVKSHSISTEHTFEKDISSPDTIHHVILELSHSIMFRLLEENKESRVLVLKIRYSDFTTTTVQKNLAHPVRSIEETYQTAIDLLEKRWNNKNPIRLLGLGFAQVKPSSKEFQGDLFSETEKDTKRKKVEQAILGIRTKYSKTIIQKGSLMKDQKKDHQDRSSVF